MDQTNLAKFVWEINNFKNKTSDENSSHNSTRFIEIKSNCLYLLISYVYKGDYSSNQTAIVLKNASYTPLNVMYKISLINENGEECFSSEIATSFGASKQTPIKNGLYFLDRNLILEEANKLLPGGKLTIKCELTLLDELKKEQADIVSKFSIKEKILENYKPLLESGKYSDVVFEVDKKEFKLHKIILTAQSPVFKAMFDSDLEESKQNRVEISDIQVEVFEDLIRFIYSANFDSIDKYDLDLFVAADMYQLDSLKDICAQSLGSKLTVDSVVSILLLADMHNSTELKSKCLSFVTKNCKKLPETEDWKKIMMNPKNFELIKELCQCLIENAK